jgi:phosphohistidine swiveling domain-containing protein
VTESTWLIDTPPSGRFPVYTRMNANDVLAGPISPLGASLLWVPHILRGWSTGYLGTGAFTPAEVADLASCGGFFYGHLYVNLSSIRLFGLRSGAGVETVDNIWFGGHPDIPPYVAQPGDESTERASYVAAFAEKAMTALSLEEVEEDKAIADRLRRERPNLSSLSDAALVARARSMAPYERLVWRGECVGGLAGGIGPGALGELLGDKDPSLIVQIMGHSGDVDSAAPAFALWDLSRLVRDDPALAAAFDGGIDGLPSRLVADHAEFAKRFGEFLRDYGYRGPNEWDIASDTWETRPGLALALIERMRTLGAEADPTARARAQAAVAEEAVARAESLLGGDEEKLATFRAAVASARRGAAWRERGKTNCIKVLHESRVAMAELGRRLHARGHLDHPRQVFMALDEELEALIEDPAMRDVLAEREAGWQELAGLDVPLFLDTTKPLPRRSSLGRVGDTAGAPLEVGESIQGIGSSPGVARGRARVILATDAVDGFEPGDVLVAPQTDPSWTPLFVVAAAAVVDVGAPNSHAMIVSRELGIPCAASAAGATVRIPDGAIVEVDGTAGTVTVLALPDRCY